MRKVSNICGNWYFTKKDYGKKLPKKNDPDWEEISLPHTWNNIDGQDGGMDYYRGICWYYKFFRLELGKKERAYLCFEGVSLRCRVYINGKLAGEHKGGFSSFNVDITDYIKHKKVGIAVAVDNSDGDDIYPRNADFTFFGGIYRNVKLVVVPGVHFDMDFFGAPGVAVTPVVNDDGSADVKAQAYISGKTNGINVIFELESKQQSVSASSSSVSYHIGTPHLWDGVSDPYLYTLTATLERNGEMIDKIAVRFGIRSFYVDPQKGFFLNGRQYPLHGVCRHQDRLDKGWALSDSDHKQDIKLIADMGANTIRLAHYQHSQEFYDLCDEYGMIVWAEIPFISEFTGTKAARDNTLSQMRELIYQNYNHPSIICWGISNEITIGKESQELYDNLEELNRLCHTIDSTRLTTMAQLGSVEPNSKMNSITDVLAYNHYFGWYLGDVNDNGKWLDDFHSINPGKCLAVSEYGAEANISFHSACPKIKDYTEEYQAFYHEKMLEVFALRPYLWATYVWNMFDFAADMRDEGGVKGRNNKGLVTYDRQTLKDSYYIYKAYWSNEPFVHINSKRWDMRTNDIISVKIYSNRKKVGLSVNGETIGELTGSKVFVFDNIKLESGDNTITAYAEDCADDIAVFTLTNDDMGRYSLGKSDDTAVANWFDK